MTSGLTMRIQSYRVIGKVLRVRMLSTMLLLMLGLWVVAASGQESTGQSAGGDAGQDNLAELGAKLSQKSVVRQDDFGQDWQIKLNIIPVIPALVKEPLF
jgi:hypothetical protein